MFKSILLPILIFHFFLLDVHGQHLSDLLGTQKLRPTPSLLALNTDRIIGCVPDSIHGYGYQSPSDSFLSNKHIYQKYGSDVTTIYIYENFNGLILYSKDSTAFNAEGLPIFNEFWELNDDSMKIVLQERTIAYPHNGPINQLLPHFFQVIQQILDPGSFNQNLYDSLIIYRRDYFSGALLPEEKIVHLFDPSGNLMEILTYEWDEIGTMDWYPNGKTNYTYSPSNKVESTEDFSWMGNQFVLISTDNFFYDSNDSLITMLSTDEQSGIVEEKLEITYDGVENTTRATSFSWDNTNLLWIPYVQILTDFDDLDRLEAFEFVLSLFGSLDATRFEYVYHDDNPCPDYSILNESSDGVNWEFYGKYFYFPNGITATEESELTAWHIYPNPTSDGIWVHAPVGSQLQITNLLGIKLYNETLQNESAYFSLNSCNAPVIVTLTHGKSSTSQLILVRS